MPDPHALLVFITTGILLNLVPGPDVLYIVGRSISQGRSAGLISALGISAGCLIHVTAATVGLSALLVAAPLAFEAIRLIGAGYLIWLGLRALLTRSQALTDPALQPVSHWTIFRQGVLTNALNPKVALFFLAFLPQFADSTRGPVAPQVLVLGLIFVFNGMLICSGYALLASRVGSFFRERYAVAEWLNRGMGVVFLGLGVRLAVVGREGGEGVVLTDGKSRCPLSRCGGVTHFPSGADGVCRVPKAS